MLENDTVALVYEASQRLIDAVPMSHRRSIDAKIDWSARLICIKGIRGAGKTTLLLQAARSHFADAKVLYASLDDLWFSTHSLRDLADWHWKNGGTHLLLDEVHRLADWQTHIKNIYDLYPGLHLVYTGSSMLQLDANGADLSRRQLTYELKGLSFREFLGFEGVGDFEILGLESILSNHIAAAREIVRSVRILEHFRNYLHHGYYPFHLEGLSGFESRLRSMSVQILDTDYPKIDSVSTVTIEKAKKMLMILAGSVPQTPRMSDLYRELDTDRNQGLRMMRALSRAGLVSLVPAKGETLKNMSRPAKILMGDPNMMHALAPNVNIGAVRETFFFNQLSQAHSLTAPRQGDFIADGRWTFEIGGAGKGFDQIKDITESFVAGDGCETGFGNKIPLWLFGFLY